MRSPIRWESVVGLILAVFWLILLATHLAHSSERAKPALIFHRFSHRLMVFPMDDLPVDVKKAACHYLVYLGVEFPIEYEVRYPTRLIEKGRVEKC
jgi:hypothetical protein